MSRDQRPGTIRVFAERRPAPLKRRQGDAPDAARFGPSAAPAPAATRHWLRIPAWLFAIGFILGGVATAARGLIDWSAL